jgi:hypothetical protein
MNRSAANSAQINGDYHIELQHLFEESLDKLGPIPKGMILNYLLAQGMSFDKNKCSGIDDIETALRKLLGTGADIILDSNWKRKTAQMQL